ncbi:hypothetical protein L1987_33614 [Smallanthus sonchifolius]|uniref:Uncharacterized protein n=1 Tax=Smallanthus sonchifolius TaxID=185202 RepID=A0ACB9HSC4_9ASTR|nr:hypothetical protein L1987_33614 [Smallanthus sonchifolius]
MIKTECKYLSKCLNSHTWMSEYLCLFFSLDHGMTGELFAEIFAFSLDHDRQEDWIDEDYPVIQLGPMPFVQVIDDEEHEDWIDEYDPAVTGIHHGLFMYVEEVDDDGVDEVLIDYFEDVGVKVFYCDEDGVIHDHVDEGVKAMSQIRIDVEGLKDELLNLVDGFISL